MGKYTYLVKDDLEALHKESLALAKRFPSGLFSELRIHPVHKENIGFWPSTALMLQQCSIGMDVPLVDNAIVVPFYNEELAVSHLRLLYMKNNKPEIKAIGPSMNGWFNLLNSWRDYKVHGQKDASTRLPVLEKFLPALTQAEGVFSDVITPQNFKILSCIGLKLKVSGSEEFLKKFATVEGFDIAIGKTEIPVTDFAYNNFCFSQLLGLSMRAVIPKAGEFLRELPYYERQEFNKKFNEIFKVDLRNVFPVLFETYSEERVFNEKLKENFRENIQFKTVNYDSYRGRYQAGISICGNVLTIELSEETVWQTLVVFFGDIVEYCKKLGGLPARYVWDKENSVRATRQEVEARLRQLCYSTFMELCRGLYGKTI